MTCLITYWQLEFANRNISDFSVIELFNLKKTIIGMLNSSRY